MITEKIWYCNYRDYVYFKFQSSKQIWALTRFSRYHCRRYFKIQLIFYEKYELLGIGNSSQQHPSFPNLKARMILYNHVVCNRTSQAGYLDNYIKITDIDFFDTKISNESFEGKIS